MPVEFCNDLIVLHVDVVKMMSNVQEWQLCLSYFKELSAMLPGLGYLFYKSLMLW